MTQMTEQELLKNLHNNGAIFAPACDHKSTYLCNTLLQQMRCAMLPAFMINLYKNIGGINLGNGYIFGTKEFAITNNVSIPDIISINKDINASKKLIGITIFGRNDLFFFGFNAFGDCVMLDPLTLNPLKKYENQYQAIFDCLIAGKN